ncbi:type VII secretion-associated serine protease mycosin [Streptomyces gossypii]|uniref:type VII secretion-associated serine protease mycosin n=1 Tax=Streptomyces gossypii TaxID=2883101 RepID=UPI00288348A3|nr:type VII secretion-associated serine protease mycosin [Streptomyces gossypii]
MGLAPAAAAEDIRSQQWYLEAMQAEKMWKVSKGEGVKVAVIDSGVSETPSLGGQVLSGKDFSGVQGGANDDYSGHGTTMAELIAGTGKGGGLRGLAPEAEIIPIRTYLSTFEGAGKPKEETAHKAIRAAVDSDARIINMSIGGYLPYSHLQEAVKYAASKGKLMFAATGNNGDGENSVEYPAAYPEVVGIASVDKTAKVSKTSTHGRHVSLAAPGDDIPGWCDQNLTSYCGGDGGTSSATAIASASAALIWSAHPDWTANQVLRVMIDTAGRADEKAHGRSDYIGYGTIRPSRVLLDGEGDPGPAGGNPLVQEEPSKSPSSSSPSGEDDKKDGEKGAADKKTVADSTGSGGDSNLLPIIGTGAAVAVLAVGAFAYVRLRRR